MKRILKQSDRQLSLLLATLVLLAVLLIFLPVILFSINQVVRSGETRYTQMEVNQAEAILKNELVQLDQLMHGISSWDDTYSFVLDQNQAYIDNNLTDPVFAGRNIHFFIALNASNTVVYAKYFDAQSQTEKPIPFEISQFLQSVPNIVRFPDIHTGQMGLSYLSGRPVLVVARPILTSLETGPARGALISGRFLGIEELSAISQLTQQNVRMMSSEQAISTTPALPVAAVLKDQVFVQSNNSNLSTGYKYLNDLNGQQTLILSVDNPRELYRQGEITARIFTGALFILALGLYGATYYFSRSLFRTRRTGQHNLERFQMVVNQSRDAMLQITSDFRVLELNPAAREMLNIKEGQTQATFLKSILALDPKLEEAQLRDLCDHRMISEFHCQRRDGVHLDIELSASQIPDNDFPAFSLILHDVTARKKIEAALQETAALLTERNEDLRASNAALYTSEERYMLAAQGSNDGLWDFNLMSGEIYFSTRWKEMLDFGEEELRPDPEEWFSRVHPDDLLPLRTQLSEHLRQHTEHFECEYRIASKDGVYRWMVARGLAVWDPAGYAHRIAGSQTDITDRKKVEEQLRYDALHDGLTGIANRTLLIDHLKHVNDRKRRNPNLIFAVFFLDLDRFKQINDTFGHQAGDQLLIETAQRLNTGLRLIDTVSRFSGPETLARIAGDEYVILLEDFLTVDDVQKVADRIAKILSAPFHIAGREVILSTSIGFVIPEQPYDQVEEIIRDADIAMYQAKQMGNGCAVRFQKAMYQKTIDRMLLENELHQAVERREFEVYYQPIYTLGNDRMAGVEALVRWNHPERGLLLPADFIHIAEDTGLIVPMGYFVLEEACRQMQAWSQEFHIALELIVSVNFSARQIMNSNLVDTIQSILWGTGFDPRKFWVEVTESTLLENDETVLRKLKELRSMGIRIEIDDFGTGYSSLSYLQNLPVDGFKIDRSFIRDIQQDGHQIIKTLVDLGHSLGLTEVAEGVETDHQKEYLKTVSCDYMQGYLMSRPVNARAIEELFRQI